MRLDHTFVPLENALQRFPHTVGIPAYLPRPLLPRANANPDDDLGQMNSFEIRARETGRDDLDPECRNCPARVGGLCRSLDPETLRLLADCKQRNRKLRPGQDLVAQGEPNDAIFNLVGGWVMLYAILENGRRQILHFALPGAVLGLESVGDATASYGIQALTVVVVCEIPRKALAPLSKARPEIAMRLAWMIGRDRSLSLEHMISLGQHSARERVTRLLLELFVRSRARWPSCGIEDLPVPLTQEHIADATGLTGVHVNRVLRRLRQDGILEFHYRRLKILDPDRLLEIAGVSAHSAMSWIDDGSAI